MTTVVFGGLTGFALTRDGGDSAPAAAGNETRDEDQGGSARSSSTTSTPAQRRAAIERERRAQAAAAGSGGLPTTLGPDSADPGSTSPATAAPGSGGQSSGGPAANPGSGGVTTPATNPGMNVPVPQAIRDAYLSGFRPKCADIWQIAGPSGQLWDADDVAGDPIGVDFCLEWADSDDAVYYETPEDAAFGGADDAEAYLFHRLLKGRLRNADGSKTWSGA